MPRRNRRWTAGGVAGGGVATGEAAAESPAAAGGCSSRVEAASRLRRACQRGVRARGRRLCSRHRDRISAGDRRRRRRRRQRRRCGRRVRRLRDGTFRADVSPRRGLCLGKETALGTMATETTGVVTERTSTLRACAGGAMLRREPRASVTSAGRATANGTTGSPERFRTRPARGLPKAAIRRR